jgi:predicted phosphodiesterase
MFLFLPDFKLRISNLLSLEICRFVFVSVFILSVFATCDDADNKFHNDGPWITGSENPGQKICISWITKNKTGTKRDYGVEPVNLENKVYFEPLQNFHHACLDSLIPDTVYYYSIPQELSFASAEHLDSFKTPKINQESFSFVIMGDMQPEDYSGSQRVETMSAAVALEEPEFVVQLGDFTQRGTVPDFWHYVFYGSASLFSTYPLYGIIGNHDQDYDQGKTWRKTFPFPFEKPESSYYFVDYNNLRMIFLDCYEQSRKIEKEQLIWLEDLLFTASADSFVFVFLHGSIYSSGMENMDHDLQVKLTPLFDKYGVDAVFYGHDHMYEHYQMTYGDNGYLFAPDHNWPHNRVHYFLSGGGGAQLESSYGILNRFYYVYKRELYNLNTETTEELLFEVRDWNEFKFVDWSPSSSTPASQNYYHLASEESYQDESEFFGQEYGENTLHYIKVEINSEEAFVTVHYPDGTLLRGPQKSNPQEWILLKK